MKRYYLFLLAVAFIISTPLLTSCSDSDGKNVSAEKTLNFYVMLTHGESAPELYDDKEVMKQLQALSSQTLAQALGGKTLVVVPETEVNTVLDNVKQAFAKLEAETNAKHAYPGLYTFTVKCNEKEVTQATFYTPEFWAFTKVENNIIYCTSENEEPTHLNPEKNPAAVYQFITTLNISRPQDYSFPISGDETLVQEFSTVYGEPVGTLTHDLVMFLRTANVSKSYNKNFIGSSSLHGGEYSASVHCDFLEYSENITNLYLTEDPGISIDTADDDEKLNSVFQLTVTTGYPYSVDDYTDDIVLNATILKEVDGQYEVVAEQPLTVKLVDDPSHTRVAGYKTIDIYKVAKPGQGKYKVRIASDWKPGNKEKEITFMQVPED